MSTRYSGDSKSGRTGMVITLAPFWEVATLPVPPLLSRPYISSVLYPSGERHDGPQAIAAASSCHVPVCHERDSNPDVPTWNCRNWQPSGLTACATNPVGICRCILNYLNKSWLRNHLKMEKKRSRIFAGVWTQVDSTKVWRLND